MGMFGSLPFSMLQPQGGGIPYGDQMPQQIQQSSMMQPQTQDMFGNASSGGVMAKPKKPGFGEPGGWGEKLAAIGDILQRAGGLSGTGAAQMLMQARQQRRDAEAARYAPQHIGNDLVHLDRNTGQYVVDYSGQDAPKPTELQRDTEAAGFTQGSPEYQAMIRDIITRRGDPFVNVTLPGNRIYAGPQSGLAAAMGGSAPATGAPTAPVGRLTPITGGAGSQAPRTFPRPHAGAR